MHLTATTQDGTYPRPRLLRGEWTSLDGTREFAYDDGEIGVG